MATNQKQWDGIVKQLNVLVNELNQNHKQMTKLILNPKFEDNIISFFSKEEM
jgi:hypothetical protein